MPDRLNEEQKCAVRETEGYVRVIAGAGSGKTRTLTARYLHLVQELGVAPRNILCVTFTNRAANVMKKRVRERAGDLDLSLICTFHAFCVQLLKEEIHRLGWPRDFLVLDEEDTKGLLRKVLAELGISMRQRTVRQVYDEVYEARKMLAESYISEILLLDNEELRKKVATAGTDDDRIWFAYLYEQKKCFGCDFNDLINFTLYILENFPATREKWRNRMQYVMVDEFQDVSGKQNSIAEILSEKHGNLFIVGDPDQTIYSWRGSHMKMLLEFDLRHDEAKTFPLLRNYRSTPQILKAADELVAHNLVRYPKQLVAQKPDGPRPLWHHAKSEKHEAAWICAKIKELLAAGLAPSGIAVLYRSHHLSRALEEVFVREQVPYKIYGGVEFYARAEVKDMLCYLRMLTVADDIAFERTVNLPPRKIGRKKLEFLREQAALRNTTLFEALRSNLDSPLFKGTDASAYVEAVLSSRERLRSDALPDVLQALADKSGYEAHIRRQGDQERLDNVAEFKRAVLQADGDELDLPEFLRRAALYSGESRPGNEETVKLMTIHSAKGMEWPAVFVCGLDEGVFPSRKTETPEDMEEERRLAYVAMTRAESLLFLTDSEGAAHDNLFKLPSRFIFECGEENIEYDGIIDRELVNRAKRFIDLQNAKPSAPEQLRQGDRVRHAVFGDGTVLSANTSAQTYSIQFDNLKTPRTLLFGAKLQRL